LAQIDFIEDPEHEIRLLEDEKANHVGIYSEAVNITSQYVKDGEVGPVSSSDDYSDGIYDDSGSYEESEY
jgi:hypothetical protein